MPVSTTIQISRDTKTDLDRIKSRENLHSYDDAVRFLLKSKRTSRRSLYGSTPELTRFEREEDDSHRVPA